jgi:hypothetical protein
MEKHTKSTTNTQKVHYPTYTHQQIDDLEEYQRSVCILARKG